MALISDPISAGESLLNTIVGTVGKYIPDPAQKAQAEQALRDSLQKWDADQTQVNAAEAVSTSLFVAGWRPAIGWVCAAALLYEYVAVPISVWLGFVFGHPIPKPPTLDDTLWQLMFGMLGMGGLRTLEKMKGVASNH